MLKMSPSLPWEDSSARAPFLAGGGVDCVAAGGRDVDLKFRRWQREADEVVAAGVDVEFCAGLEWGFIDECAGIVGGVYGWGGDFDFFLGIEQGLIFLVRGRNIVLACELSLTGFV
jgi:hypothetical protein